MCSALGLSCVQAWLGVGEQALSAAGAPPRFASLACLLTDPLRLAAPSLLLMPPFDHSSLPSPPHRVDDEQLRAALQAEAPVLALLAKLDAEQVGALVGRWAAPAARCPAASARFVLPADHPSLPSRSPLHRSLLWAALRALRCLGRPARSSWWWARAWRCSFPWRASLTQVSDQHERGTGGRHSSWGGSHADVDAASALQG